MHTQIPVLSPGASTFNVEPVVNKHDYEDFIEVLDELPVGAMAFGSLDPSQLNPANKWMELTTPVLLGPLEEWQNHYPRWNETGI